MKATDDMLLELADKLLNFFAVVEEQLKNIITHKTQHKTTQENACNYFEAEQLTLETENLQTLRNKIRQKRSRLLEQYVKILPGKSLQLLKSGQTKEKH